jgi:hypothetical protein
MAVGVHFLDPENVIAVTADGEMGNDFANDGRIDRMRATKGRS